MPITSLLERLPVELLHEIHLFALNHAFPHSSKQIYQVFKEAPTSYVALYIIFRAHSKKDGSDTITRALRYPLCNQDVIETLVRLLSFGKAQQVVICELPKRLFRNLNSNPGIQRDDEDPLPFLRYLYAMPGLRPDPNSHEGYALTRAVHARHEPLIRFLLDQGASPSSKQGLCVMVAIKQKNLRLVRMLIEREDKSNFKGTVTNKKRKLEDRVVPSKDMVDLALRCDARDIAEYLTLEKGIIPDIRTLLGI